MSVHPQQPTHDQEALELLQHLIESPPSKVDSWHAPVALRSRDEHRRHALRRFLLKNWVDRTLGVTERLLAVAAFVVFGFWFVDGPVRDWVHERSVPQAQAVGSTAAQGTKGSTETAATAAPALLPSEGNPTPALPATERRGTGAAASLADSAPLPYVGEGPLPGQGPLPSAPGIGQGAGAAGSVQAASVPDTPPVAQPAPRVTQKVSPEPTRLRIPAIGLDTGVREVFVVDGTWEVAEYAAGYLTGTALPGEVGNTALAGHAGLRGAVFRDLGALAPGHEVFVDAGGKRYRYIVRETRAVWPTQVEVLDPTPTPTLTLITCTNWDTQRLVVVADLADSQPAT
ncbi:MAG: hypothetical protein RLZZ387_2724 [Chloroflexota bacterium]